MYKQFAFSHPPYWFLTKYKSFLMKYFLSLLSQPNYNSYNKTTTIIYSGGQYKININRLRRLYSWLYRVITFVNGILNWDIKAFLTQALFLPESLPQCNCFQMSVFEKEFHQVSNPAHLN